MSLAYRFPLSDTEVARRRLRASNENVASD